MPYDPIKARRLMQNAQAFERLPASEFVMELAKALKEADDEIRDFTRSKAAIEDDAKRYQREAETERENFRKLRENAGAGFEKAVAYLREIAGMTKGAKKKAEEALRDLFPPPEPQKPEAPAERIDIP